MFEQRERQINYLLLSLDLNLGKSKFFFIITNLRDTERKASHLLIHFPNAPELGMQARPPTWAAGAQLLTAVSRKGRDLVLGSDTTSATFLP